MTRNLMLGFFMAVLVFTSIPVWALPEIKSDRPTDQAFLGDNAEISDELQILESKEILLLDDQKLVDAYIDAVVEIDATRTFHATSGFTPKQFKKFKNLLKYRLQLLFEINRRKMEVPAEVKS